MRIFSANDYLMLWEQGEALHPVDRALLVLSCALPENSYDTLACLPLGRRDRLLMEVRRAHFGDRIEAHAVCGACAERVEFELSCSALLANTQTADSGSGKITLNETLLELRCPNSLDLAAAAACMEIQTAEELLLTRCVEQVSPEAASLTPARRAAIAEALSTLDPAAEILIDLICPACGSGSQTLFDINKCLWLEICARALRLLQEVDTLARIYHWSETDILSMNEARRSLYLEMALS
jgi:hypothetical protein